MNEREREILRQAELKIEAGASADKVNAQIRAITGYENVDALRMAVVSPSDAAQVNSVEEYAAVLKQARAKLDSGVDAGKVNARIAALTDGSVSDIDKLSQIVDEVNSVRRQQNPTGDAAAGAALNTAALGLLGGALGIPAARAVVRGGRAALGLYDKIPGGIVKDVIVDSATDAALDAVPNVGPIGPATIRKLSRLRNARKDPLGSLFDLIR